ncbi:MAG: hypothetical protein FJ040_10890 [Chloroflexi bacterium]|nr:hypothetical protein [Chloroflexota bacterium]
MKLSIWQRLFRRNQTNELLRKLIDDQQRIVQKLDALQIQVHHLSTPMSNGSTTRITTPEVMPHASNATNGDAPTSRIIQSLLESRGISIKSLPTVKQIDPVHDEIARLIGSKYYTVAPLLDHIKRTMQLGHTFTFNLSQQSQQGIADITLVARKLHELAFLTQFHYQKAPKCLLSARPNTHPDIQNFFSGDWLERYVKQMLENIANETRADCAEIMTNPQIMLPNGDNFELDLLAFVNQRLYWVECKTGAYQEHISKYSRFAQILKLSITQSVMVLPDAHESLTLNLSRAFGMHVVNMNELIDHFDREFSQP